MNDISQNLSPAYRQTPEYSKASSIAAKEQAKVRHVSDGDTSRRAPIAVSNLDLSPAAIGGLFRKAALAGLPIWIECGERLKAKRLSLPRGAWLPWIDASAEILGFGERTAQLLIKATAFRPQLTSDLTQADALKINRLIWGNSAPKPAPQISLKPDPSIVAIVPATAPPEPLFGQAADAAMEKVSGELKAEKLNTARLEVQVADLTHSIEKLEAENKVLRERIASIGT